MYLCTGISTVFALSVVLRVGQLFMDVPVPMLSSGAGAGAAGDRACWTAFLGIEIQDKNGDTALHFAMLASCDKIVSMLVNLGADVLVCGYEGTTVLMKPFLDEDLELRAVVPANTDGAAAVDMDVQISRCLVLIIGEMLKMNK
jgi:hypothetical protein